MNAVDQSMTVTHSLAPAPRRGASADVDLPDAPGADEAAEILRAAQTLADAGGATGRCHGGSALTSGPACARAAECERAGVITVVTEHDTTHLCGMHAMTAVFTTQGLLALVKPDGA